MSLYNFNLLHYSHLFIVDFSIELQRTMKSDLVSLDFINEYALLERKMVNSFQSNVIKNIREGNLKKSFNYLLIDPRISENLLVESQVNSKTSIVVVIVFESVAIDSIF